MVERGLPLFWSALGAVFFAIAGTYIYLTESGMLAIPGLLGAIFGFTIFAIGLKVQFSELPEPYLYDDEEVEVSKKPEQSVALVTTVAGVGVVLVATVLMYYTGIAYIVPIIGYLGGAWLVGLGYYRYWTNHLTRVYLTDQRFIKAARLFSSDNDYVERDEIDKIVSGYRSLENLLGLGNLTVRGKTDGGEREEIKVRNIKGVRSLQKRLHD